MTTARKAQESPDRESFRRLLLRWYKHNQRDLPWRGQSNPYRIWVSEIMLQQTRVNAVLEHYQRFLRRFPTVETLSRARQSSVLAAWSGLGYYRRARMLHAAAKEVVARGGFPLRAEELRGLPGIGRYTAAAVASIAFGEPTAVVDGNVERVLARVTGKQLSGEPLWAEANRLLDASRPGYFNQALMELGATVCLPGQPLCSQCPVFGLCRSQGKTGRRAGSPRQRKQEISYVLARRNGSVFLVQRPADASLMAGMWELPEGQDSPPTNGICRTFHHSITVTNYTVRVCVGRIPRKTSGSWIRDKRLARLPMTGLTRKVLRAFEIGRVN